MSGIPALRRVVMEKLDLKKKWKHLYQPSG